MYKETERRSGSFRVVILFTLVILALFIRHRHADIVPIEDIVENENFVDTYTSQISSTKINEQGEIIRILQADSAEHYALSNESELDAPYIQSTSERGKTWRTSALNGKVRADESTYDLWNKVVIEQLSSQAVARTDKLTFFSEARIAKTSDKVVIDSRMGQTIGIGMHANLKTEVIKLLSEVRSVFEPPQK